MRLRIFTTGGTIDKIYFDQKGQYEIGDPQALGLMEKANVAVDYKVEPIMRRDSLDMTDDDRQMIRNRIESCSENRIIITHGTDKMIETAKTLVGIADKTIVLTGAMYPARFHESDAVFNLGGAVLAVQILPAGVYIIFNGRVFNPLTSYKNVEKNCFEEYSSAKSIIQKQSD